MTVHHVERVMGMAVSIDARDASTDADSLAPALRWLHEVDARFSTYRDDSEITRFSRGEIGIDDLEPETQNVLLRCIELTDVTLGAFDVFVVPAPNGTTTDPSGYVKGWAVERAADLIWAGGARNFCINAGGDIAIRGCPSPGQRWTVGIRHPDSADQVALAIELEGPIGIATSATYERGAHIIDPSTGAPTTVLASATVVGPDLGTADAFATAVFVMGIDGLDWIETQDGYSTYVIDHDGMTSWSSRFPHPTLVRGH
jgi:thiamine biosynthesis lipoprotein